MHKYVEQTNQNKINKNRADTALHRCCRNQVRLWKSRKPGTNGRNERDICMPCSPPFAPYANALKLDHVEGIFSPKTCGKVLGTQQRELLTQKW